MRPAVLLLLFAVCEPPHRETRPEPDPIARLEETAARDARRGDFAASSRIYRRLAEIRVTSPSRCRWQVAVVRNTLAAGNKREQAEEIRRLAALDRMFPGDACHRELHDILAELVFVWNRELTMGCTAYSWPHWPLLEQLFHEFLADFPDDPRAPEARRALERLYALERK